VGPGNNGGDGLVCARHLALWVFSPPPSTGNLFPCDHPTLIQGFRPTILYPKPSKSELMRRLVVQTQSLPYLSELSMSPSELSRTFPLIVDAIFGFSFTPPIRSPFDGIIETIAKCDSHVFSIDIPSGVNLPFPFVRIFFIF
jgi:NAD(P)H-hydrate epimerase